MWLMTKHGFYSVVEKRKGEFHIRSRERGDLQNLVDRVPLADCRVIDTPDADYAARVVTNRDTVGAVVQFLAGSLDYGNFKGVIGRTPDQSHKPYHDVWKVMADALGAYGRSGTARPMSPGHCDT